MRLQDLLDCGGPPQTGRSSGREQKDDAGHTGIAIELAAERVEIHGGERRLPMGSAASREPVPERGSQDKRR